MMALIFTPLCDGTCRACSVGGGMLLVRPILQLSVPESKSHRNISIPGRRPGLALPKMRIESFFLSVLFSSGYIALAMPSGWQFRLSSFGFLDTFDLFDNSRAALPESFL
jgi:hypothetical protein